jgi:hypothetical protein
LKIEKKYNMEYRQAHNFIIFGDKGSGSAIDYKTDGGVMQVSLEAK